MRIVTVIIVAICTAIALSTPTAPVRAQQTWTVQAGGGTQDSTVFAQTYFPKTIEVAVGDTVRWTFPRFHTVTFLSGMQAPDLFTPEGGRNYFNPQVFFPVGGPTYDGTGYRNSGTPQPVPNPPPHTYELTFTRAGSFQYVCVVHPGMTGTVVVKDTVMTTPAQVRDQAKKEETAVIQAGLAAWARHRPVRQGRSVTVPMIGNARDQYSIFRFTREPLVISRGTMVTWKMADPFEIHTVTFLSGRRPKPGDEIRAEPQAQGPPKLRFASEVERPAGRRSYAGRGYVNSGILFTPPFVPPGGKTSYSLTFTRTGRYEYWCMVHIGYNMKGNIVVR